MKRIFAFFLILSIIACSKSEKAVFNIQEHIPANSELILISPDLNNFIAELGSNYFIQNSNFSLKENLLQQLSFIEKLKLKKETGIAFSGISQDAFIYTIFTEKDSSLISFDSIKNKSVETIKEESVEFQRISIEENKFFLYESDNASIISNSKSNLLDLAKNRNLINDETFNKALNASDRKKTSVFLRHSLIQPHFSKFFENLKFPGIKNFASWSVMDLDLNKDIIKTNGISLSDKSKNLLNFFSDNDPKQTETGKICPSEFQSFYSISFSSFNKIFKNLKADSSSVSYPKILDHTREAASIVLSEGNALALNATEIETARESLAGLGSELETFRGTSIFQLDEEISFQETFSNLMKVDNSQFYTIIDHFVIFSGNTDILKSFIISYQNSDTLGNKTYFTDLMSSLSSESSLLFVTRPEKVATESKNKSENFKFRKNSLAAFQFIIEDDFAHIHGILSNSETAAVSNGVEQTASYKIDAPVITTPEFFKNHRTDQMDIAVQDKNNQLYLISNKGTIFWKKKLDSQINSPVFQVDLFKNGNQQLAFSTGYNFEVLDRNGNKVQGFPIKFNEPLTQPLSVFDYDNNRNYRFVLTQNKRVYMVGPKGNSIKGFDFENAKAEIVKAPKHIRLGTKDYILIAEESGKLNILSRQGNIRVPVNETFEFSENEWYGHQGKFISSNPNDNLIEITQSGAVSYKNSGLAENNRVVADDENLVYLNENELSINSKIVNLDFGLYTDPQLFTFRNRSLIAITDTQTQKVYVFDARAELLEGFPVYGTSQVDIANADLDPKLELIVKGEENEILMYEF